MRPAAIRVRAEMSQSWDGRAFECFLCVYISTWRFKESLAVHRTTRHLNPLSESTLLLSLTILEHERIDRTVQTH